MTVPSLVACLALLSAPTGEADDVADLSARAAALDALIEQALPGQPAPALDDRGWFRRLSLDVLGRIPTSAESAAFLAEPGADRDGRWIDAMLDLPGHRSRMQTWWSDLLRARSELGQRASGEPFLHWIRQAIEEDRPYDDMVVELLTASGPAHAPGNGATGLLMRDREMPEDSMANTVRVFLGTRIECAQCHDHPFEPWKREQFFEMVAFTGGLEYESSVDDLAIAETARLVVQDMQDRYGGRQKRNVARVLRPVTAGLVGSGTATVALPDANGEPTDQWLHARTILTDTPGPEVQRPTPTARQRRRGRVPEPEPVDARAALAAWMVDADNPRFHRVLANRLWKLAFGRGLIEPLDDLRSDSVASHPALLDALEQLVLDLDHDVDAVLAVLLRTRAYRRVADAADTPWQQPPAAPLMRRLGAEQVWDSLLTLVREDVDATIAPPLTHAAAEVYEQYEDMLGASFDELLTRVEVEHMRRTDRDAYQELKSARTASRRAERRNERDLLRGLRQARGRGDGERMAELVDALGDSGVDVDGPRRVKKNDLVRASELPSPAPPDHFLAVFGQSDREQVQAADHEPNVPQALTLLNGFVDEHLVGNREAALAQQLRDLRGTTRRVERAFHAILCRDPTRAESDLWEATLELDGRSGLEDLVWTLVNSHEFLFLR